MKKILVTIVLIAAIIGLANTMAFAQEKAPQIVKGTITDNGVPVWFATVRLYNSRWCYQLSSFQSTNGLYEIRGSVPSGTYRIKVNFGGKWAQATFSYSGMGPAVVNLPLSSGLEPATPACPD